MNQKEFKKIVISEIEKSLSVYNILDLKNRSPDQFIARRLYYSILHIMKNVNNYTYKDFTRTESSGMMDAMKYSRTHKGFTDEVRKLADRVKERIIKEQEL